MTIAYKHSCPSFLDNVFGVDPSEVHLHIRRIPAKEIPESESEMASWLIDAFQLKDQLLEKFKSEGCFPNQGTEEQLSTLKCSLNFLVVVSFTALFIYLTFFSSIWCTVYVGLACVFLACATYFNFRTKPILSYGCKKTE